MKMKEFGPPGGVRVPGAPPLDLPLQLIREKAGTEHAYFVDPLGRTPRQC